MLNGKYYATLTQRETDKEKQIAEYCNKLAPRFENISKAISEGVIPEMEENDSLYKFYKKFESKPTFFFGNKFDERFTAQLPHRYIFAVYDCLYNDFTEGVTRLKRLPFADDDNAALKELKKCAQNLLANGGDSSKERFISNVNSLIEERAAKYKYK